MNYYGNNTYYNTDICHFGILGMKWGHHSIKSIIAKKQNDKVDKGFKKWKENDKKKENAIELGKKAFSAKYDYEQDRSNSNLKEQYKKANKDYKKALSENTTYRKGVIKKEVGENASRKYLSEAKKIKKKLDSDPNNKNLEKKYYDLLGKHDIERASARRAVDVSTKRMNRIRSIKSIATKTVKGLAVTAAVGIGLAATNKYLLKNKVNVNSQQVIYFAKKVKDTLGFIY